MLNALEVHGLCKRYDSFALVDVSLIVPRGYVMGLIGPNGAGKTTTLKLILNLPRPDAGTIRGDFSGDSIRLADSEDRGLYNLVHAADSAASARRETRIWFSKVR